MDGSKSKKIRAISNGSNANVIFPNYSTMNDLLSSAAVAGGFTLGVFLLFVVVYWAFRGFLPGSRVVEQELVAPTTLNGTSAKFKLFFVGWCPYSKDAFEKMKEFEGLVSQYTYGGKRVQLEFVDCDVHKDDCALYKVDAYPTYKLETSVKMFEYIGPASTETYRQFLVSALGKEEPAN